MKDQELIDRYYKEAVARLNEIILADKDLWYSHVINLPLHLQVVYTIGVFNQQVLNGGLHQYFFNSYGQFAYLTVKHLKLIKAFTASDVLERALREVNSEQLSVNEFRARIFDRKLDKLVNFDEQLCDSLESLDNEYYNLNEDLGSLFNDYLGGSLGRVSK